MKACNVEKRDGEWWCLDCNKPHIGHVYDLSQEMTPLAQSYRDLWRGKTTAPVLLRSLPHARQCIYLGNQLTLEEGRLHDAELLAKGLKCNTCNGQRKEHHCKVHRFTNLAKCMNCTDWKRFPDEEGQMVKEDNPKACHDNPALSDGYSWSGKHKEPYQLNLMLNYNHDQMPAKEIKLTLHSFGAVKVWGMYDLQGDYATLTYLEHDGPRRSFHLSMKQGPVELAGFKVTLHSEEPFLGTATGMLTGNEHGGCYAADPALIGTHWVGTVAQC